MSLENLDDLEAEWAEFTFDRVGKRSEWSQDQRWRVDNPGKFDKLLAYRADRTQRPDFSTSQRGSTELRMLEHLDAWHEAKQVVEEPPPPPPPTNTLKKFGLASNADHSAPMVQSLGCKTVRYEWNIAKTAAELDSTSLALANAGAKIIALAGFHGFMPTVAQAQALRLWADRHGPNGTNRILLIEFGNETSFSYQYSHSSPWYNSPEYIQRAKDYADRAYAAAVALQGSGVGLLVQADHGGSNNDVWVKNMLQKQPGLKTVAAGWTVHPYGPTPSKIDVMKSQLAAQGVSDPAIYVTEWGLATDNGRSLNNNYGWPVNQTYQQAADALNSTMASWDSKYGAGIKVVCIYQTHDLRSPGATTEREHYFGVLQINGAEKGAYTAAAKVKFAL